MRDSDNFFDRHDRFYETSFVGTKQRGGIPSQRLARRWDAIVDANRPLFQNARVLDMASHDGRWSLAAIDAGAKHVLGIEGRPKLVALADRTLTELGAWGQFHFVAGDMLAEMAKLQQGDFDLILNLGFLYHTARHYDIFQEMHRLRPKAIILDTRIASGRGSIVRYKTEPHQSQAMSIRSTSGINSAIVGIPSHEFIVMMCDFFGFTWSLVDWSQIGDDDEGIEDYRADTRRTYALLAK